MLGFVLLRLGRLTELSCWREAFRNRMKYKLSAMQGLRTKKSGALGESCDTYQAQRRQGPQIAVLGAAGGRTC